jgi:hypothetical protein
VRRRNQAAIETAQTQPEYAGDAADCLGSITYPQFGSLKKLLGESHYVIQAEFAVTTEQVSKQATERAIQ